MPPTHPRRRASRAAALSAAALLAAGIAPLAAASASPRSLGANAEVAGPAAALHPAERIKAVPLADTNTDKPIFPMQTEPHCLVLNNYGAARRGRIHVGLDIMADTKLGPTQEIYAVVDGTLTYQYIHVPNSESLSGNGWRLTSAVSKTYYTYLHMSTFAPGLAVGSRVNQGDLIGYVGDTGNNAGNYHLHFEVHPTGTSASTIDPLNVLTIPPECKP